MQAGPLALIDRSLVAVALAQSQIISALLLGSAGLAATPQEITGEVEPDSAEESLSGGGTDDRLRVWLVAARAARA